MNPLNGVGGESILLTGERKRDGGGHGERIERKIERGLSHFLLHCSRHISSESVVQIMRTGVWLRLPVRQCGGPAVV